MCAGVAQSFRRRRDFFSFSLFPGLWIARIPLTGEATASSRRTWTPKQENAGLKQENARASKQDSGPQQHAARVRRGRVGIARRRRAPGHEGDEGRHPHRLRRTCAPSSWSSTRTATGWPRAAREKPARVSLLAAPMLEQIERVSTACWASRRFSAPRVAFYGQSTRMGDAEETEAPARRDARDRGRPRCRRALPRARPARRSARVRRGRVQRVKARWTASESKARSKESAARKAREDDEAGRIDNAEHNSADE